MHIVPDFVDKVWDEVEVGPVHKKVGEHYHECHDEMQTSKDDQQVVPKPQFYCRNSGQAHTRPLSIVPVV